MFSFYYYTSFQFSRYSLLTLGIIYGYRKNSEFSTSVVPQSVYVIVLSVDSLKRSEKARLDKLAKVAAATPAPA